ncbi:hypothetical protein BGW42_000647 [Actinomortierella wolfii]|nr:hypothetical protein BGW42_000647 [Actinomortierella wolfii]
MPSRDDRNGGRYDRGGRGRDRDQNGDRDTRPGHYRDELDRYFSQEHEGRGRRGAREDGDDSRPSQPYRGGRRSQDQLSHFNESRREQRNAIQVSIWAPSPTESELRNRSPSPDREVKKKSKSKKSRKHDSDSDDDRSDSRRSKKSKKSKRKRSRSRSSRHRSHRHRSSRRSSRSRRDRSSSVSDRSGSEDEEEEDRRRRRRRSSRRSRSRSRSRSPTPVSRSPSPSAEVHKEKASTPAPAAPSSSSKPSLAPPIEDEYSDDMWVEKEVVLPGDDMEVGPAPLQLRDKKMDERSYGGALLAGEGSAMAAYVQEGKRIPRRGEIGLESEQIEAFENAGFVMSGSRHHRMNAVRVRKENQVLNAEQKREMLRYAQEEKLKKDNKIINDLREMAAARLRSTGHQV